MTKADISNAYLSPNLLVIIIRQLSRIIVDMTFTDENQRGGYYAIQRT